MSSRAQMFQARSLPEALALVKRALGPDAVILKTRRADPRPGAAGPGPFEIHAAPAVPARAPAQNAAPTTRTPPPDRTGPAAPQPNTPPSSASRAGDSPGMRADQQLPLSGPSAPAAPPERSFLALDDPLHAHYVELVQREVAAELAAELLRRARAAAGGSAGHEDVRAALKRVIAEMIPIGETPHYGPETSRQLALVGPPGSGKTSMLTKLAARFKVRQGLSVGLLSLDNQRLAGGETLRRYAALLEIPFRQAQTSPQARQAARDLSDCQIVLIDTPGIGPRDELRLERIRSMLAAAEPHEVHLVLAASASAAVQQRAARRFGPLSPSHLILTRLDEAVGLGAILNLIHELNCPLRYVADGQRIPGDMGDACGTRLAQLVFHEPV